MFGILKAGTLQFLTDAARLRQTAFLTSKIESVQRCSRCGILAKTGLRDDETSLLTLALSRSCGGVLTLQG